LQPWNDFKQFNNTSDRLLAHAVQTHGKIFSKFLIGEIKKDTLVIEIRRQDKIKQFASWMYFKHIECIYNFQHSAQDYIQPKSITATLEDIEEFIISQLVDNLFDPDYILYYENLIFAKSKIKKNFYVYPIEHIFSNIELVREHLSNWKYYD